jgi:starch synthase (maltosyl-transferring)
MEVTRAPQQQILTVVSLNPHAAREGWVCLALPDDPVANDERYTVRDLLTDQVYEWTGPWNWVRLDPELPAHILDVKRSASAKATTNT